MVLYGLNCYGKHKILHFSLDSQGLTCYYDNMKYV